MICKVVRTKTVTHRSFPKFLVADSPSHALELAQKEEFKFKPDPEIETGMRATEVIVEDPPRTS